MSITNSATQDFPPALLEARPRTIYVEMTSRCNLRCVYCPVSQDDYLGEDLALAPDTLAALLVRCSPDEVQLSGHGETTMLSGWTEVARELLRAGLPLTITSNFAKRFSDDEVDLLSRFRALKISCDTDDAELLTALRRGLKLQKLEDNLARIVQHCESEHLPLPFLHISCTLTHANVPGLPALVRWTHASRAHALGLVNLVRHSDIEGALAVRHPSEVDPALAKRAIAEAQAVADELSIRLDMEPGLLDSLEVGQRWQ